MGISFNLPELNIKEDEVKLLLAIKLLDEGVVSLGKAAEIAGYSEVIIPQAVINEFGSLSLSCCSVKKVESNLLKLLITDLNLGTKVFMSLMNC